MKTSTTPDGFTNWYFSRAELIALLAHASTDETRFAMCGIGLDVTQGAAMATDGHRAAKVWGERVNYDCAVVPKHVLCVSRNTTENAVKTAKRDDLIMMVTRTSDEPVLVYIGEGGPMTSTRLTDAQYPTLDQVMPKHEVKNHRGVATGIDTAYLADLNLVSKACPPVVRDLPRGAKEKRYPGLTLFPPVQELDPWFARVSCPQNATEWRVCIMPMRV